MRSRIKKVFGVGINDVDYQTQIFEYKDGKRELVFCCPFYRKWKDMLHRCDPPSWDKKFPFHRDCTFVPEWAYLSVFKAWMEKQDWEGKQLDKDLLVRGNKLYGPETCCFLEKKVNCFLTDSKKVRGEWPIGVTYNKAAKKFLAHCSDGTKSQVHLGLFECPQEAFQAWLAFKLKMAVQYASEMTDQRAALALVDRYKNYQEIQIG